MKKFTIVGICTCGCGDMDGEVHWVYAKSPELAQKKAPKRLHVIAVFAGHRKCKKKS